MHDLDSIKEKIIKNNFQELSDLVIMTDYKRLEGAYFDYDRLTKKEYQVMVESSLIRAPVIVVTGGMAHEIAHILRDGNMNFMLFAIDRTLYDLWQWYQTRDERQTDLLVVNRGLGLELLSFVEYANKRRANYTKRDGLTATELRKLLRKNPK